MTAARGGAGRGQGRKPGSVKPGSRGCPVSVRFTEAELARVEQAAEAVDTTTTGFVRDAAVQRAASVLGALHDIRDGNVQAAKRQFIPCECGITYSRMRKVCPSCGRAAS